MPKSAEQRRFDLYSQMIHKEGKVIFAGTLLQRAARLFADEIALICEDNNVTYKELYYRASQVTKQLQAMNVKPKDKVCIWYGNSIEFYCAYFGAWQCGAVVVPVNTFLQPQEFMHILHDCKPAALVVSDQLLKKLANYEGDLPPLLREDEIDMVSEVPKKVVGMSIPDIGADDMAALLYTSGTTGVPKGVMLSSKNILMNTIQGVSRLDVSPNDRVLAPLPLFHSFAQNCCVWGSFFIGATVIVIPRIERRKLLDGIAHKPTFILGVPSLYGLFCLMKTVPFDSVRYFITGGDALPDKIRVAFELVYNRRLCNGYGLTEASPVIAVNFDDELIPASTVGRPLVGVECSLRDEIGKEVDPGDVGQLWVKGDNIMLGYFNASELTDAVLKNGWFDTGDLARFDDSGRLVIVGREKDLIIHKGFNVYPQEIENILLSHPLVMKAAVIGKKDASVGEIPIAFVELKEDKDGIEKELKMLCIQQLAAYKRPRDFIVMKKLPMTALAKVNKKELRVQYGKD